jgi:hypothetical protein
MMAKPILCPSNKLTNAKVCSCPNPVFEFYFETEEYILHNKVNFAYMEV